MDYEKAYKEALKRAKNLHEDAIDMGENIRAKQCEIIFPELAESEYEKNIKDLIDELKCSLRAANCQNEACNGGHEKRIALLEWAIAWLERQDNKDSKKVSIWKHWKDGIAGSSEGKQIYLIKSGLRYSISSCLGHECDYIELSELDKLMVDEKQDEKKGAITADKELYECIRNTCACIDDAMSSKSVVDIKDYLKQASDDAHKAFEWMEKRMETPKENEGKISPKWSKEDEEEFIIAIETLYEAGQHSSAMWLKSIKQRIVQ